MKNHWLSGITRVLLSALLLVPQNTAVLAEEEPEEIPVDETAEEVIKDAALTEEVPEEISAEETGSSEETEPEPASEEEQEGTAPETEETATEPTEETVPAEETSVPEEISSEKEQPAEENQTELPEDEETEPELITEKLDLSAHVLQDGGLLRDNDSEASAFSVSEYVSDEVLSALSELLAKSAAEWESEVDISDYKVPVDGWQDVFTWLINDNPQLFYVSTIRCRYYTNSDTVSIMLIDYKDTYTKDDVSVFNSTVSDILSKVDSDWSQEQKALYLHDQVVLRVKYDWTLTKRDAYQALVNGISVCQGYSLAYKYLLSQVGIESDYITSAAKNHAWNSVVIDGQSYFVDTTADDTSNWVRRVCAHHSFLRNRDDFYNSASTHEATDWVNSRGENVYDPGNGNAYPNAYWLASETQIPHVGNLWAYTKGSDDANIYVHDYSDGSDRVLTSSLTEKWYVIGSTTSSWGYRTSLDSYQDSFVVSQPGSVYAVKTDGTAEKVGTISEEEFNENRIYGIEVEQNKVRYDLYPQIATSESKVNYEPVSYGYFQLAEDVHVSRIDLNNNECEMTPGSTNELVAYVYPENATDKRVTWTSSDPSVASVDAAGTVTGVAPGTAVIRATSVSDPEIYVENHVTIKAETESITVSETELNLHPGDTHALTITIYPEDSIDTYADWTSDNTAVATVDQNGVVTAVSEGTAVITASSHLCAKKATCTVTVTSKPVYPDTVSIISSEEGFTIEEGSSTKLTAQVNPETAEYDSIVWNSSDTSVAVVSEDGTVTGVSAGTASISATVNYGENQVTAECEITVTAKAPVIISVTGVSVYPASLNLKVNETGSVEAVVQPGNATNQNVTWSSDNTAVAAVDSDGTVHAVGEGTANITVTTEDGGFTAVCTVTVKNETAEAERAFTGTENSLYVRVKTPYTTSFAYTADGNPGDLSELKLRSSDGNTDLSEILFLSRNENGEIVLTGKKVGYYSFGVYYGETQLATGYVNVDRPSYTEVYKKEDQWTEDVIRGLDEQLQLNLYYDFDGKEGDYSELAFKSSNESVFEVVPSEDHRTVTVIPVGYGRAYVEVYADWDYEGSMLSSIPVDIREEIPEQGEFVEVTSTYSYDRAASSVRYDQLQTEDVYLQYYIDGVAAGRTAIASKLSARSTDETIAKAVINTSGYMEITAVGYGKADIIVSGPSSDLLTIHVEIIQPDAYSAYALFDPLYVAVGETAEIVYTLSPENAKPAVSEEFTSSDTSIATVNENGIVRGVAEGSTRITMTLKMPNGDTLNASQSVTVGNSDKVIQAVNSGNNHITLTLPEEIPQGTDYITLKLHNKATGEVFEINPYRFKVNGNQLSFNSTNLKFGMYRLNGGSFSAGEYFASVYISGLGTYQINSLILDETIYNSAPEHINVETDDHGLVLRCADGDDACYSYLEALYDNQCENTDDFDDWSYTYVTFAHETLDAEGNMISTATGGFPTAAVGLMNIFEAETENNKIRSLTIPSSVFEAYGIYDGTFTLQFRSNVGIISKSYYTTPEEIQIPSSLSKDSLAVQNLHWTEAGDLQFYVPIGTAYLVELTSRREGIIDRTRGTAKDSISVLQRYSTLLKDGETYSVRVYTADSEDNLRKSAVRYEMPGFTYSCWKTVDQPVNLRWYDSGTFVWDSVGGATEYYVTLYKDGEKYADVWTSDTFCSDYEEVISSEPDAEWQFSVQAIGELNTSYNSAAVSSLSYPENAYEVTAADIPVAVTLDGKAREDDTHILVRRSDRTSEKGYVINQNRNAIPGLSFTEAGEFTYLVYLAHDNLSIVPVYDTYKLTYTVTGESGNLTVSDPVIVNEQGKKVSTVTFDLETTKPASFAPEAEILLNGAELPAEYDGKFTFLLKDDEGNVLQTVKNSGSYITFDSLSGLDDQVKYFYTIVAQDLNGFVAENDVFHLVLDLNDVKEGVFVPEVTYEASNYNKVDGITFNLIEADYTAASEPVEVQVLKNEQPAEEISFIRRDDADGKEDSVTVITKNGTAELPSITFTSAGEYRYSVFMPEDNTAFIRDKAVYEIIYKVEETDGFLKITDVSLLDKDGNAAESVVFRIQDKQAVTAAPYAVALIDGDAPLDGSVTMVLKDDEGRILQTKTNVGSLVTFDELEFRDIGRYYYSIEQTEGNFSPNPESGYKFNVYVTATETGFETECFYLIPTGNSYTAAEEAEFTNSSVALAAISLTENEAVMSKGDEKQLTVEFTPENATVRDLVWESDNEDVAVVDEDGLVTAVGNGKAVITVSAENGTILDTCEISVNAELKGISFEETDLVLAREEEYLLEVLYNPEDTTDDKTVTWTSSDENVVTVDEEGKLTAVGTGTATVTAATADGRFTAECKVTVVVYAESMKLSAKEEEILHAGETLDVDVIFTPEDAYEKITWTSSDETVAAVDENGVVTALKSGETTITASNEDGSLSESFRLIVAVDVEGISLDKTEETLYINGEVKDQVQLIETITPENATITDVTWTSSDENVAAVDENGLVTAVNGGTAVITATTKDGEHTAECTVTVIVSVTGVKIFRINEEGEEETVTADEMNIGDTKQFNAKVLPENATNQKIIWESSDAEIAAVDETGLVTALAEGDAVISATSEDGDWFAEVKVAVSAVAVTGIAAEESMIVPIGTQKKIEYAIEPANATNKNVIFESDDEEIAVVSEDGVITGVSRGTAVITLRAEDTEITREITVNVVPDGIYMGEIEREYEYTGSAIKPEVKVYDRGIELTSSDYTVTYANNVKAGTASITIKMKGNYSGTVTENFVITPIDLGEDERITYDALTMQANGKTLNPVPAVYFNGTKLKSGTDFTIDYNGWDGKADGDWDLKLIGQRNYTGEMYYTVNVAERSADIIPVTKLKVTAKTVKYQDLSGEDFIEDIIDSGIVTIKNGTKVLKYEDDYEIYEIPEDYRQVGTLKFTISGVGDYYGDRTVSVKITGISINDKKIKNVDPEGYVYTGEAQELHEGFHLTYNGEVMDPEDYEILEDTYTNNLKVGTASVKIEGRNGFTGTRTVKYKITANKTSITAEDITVEQEVPYAKGGAKAAIEVYDTDLGLELIEGTDYTLKYANNKKVGTGTVTVTFKGNFKGTVKQVLNYSIVKKNLEETEMTAKDVVYNSKAGKYKSTPVITDTDGKTLKAGTDYEKAYVYELENEDGTYTLLDAKSVAEAGSVIRVTVKGKETGNYTGEISTEYRILEKGYDISKAAITIANQEYTGEAVELVSEDFKALINKTENLYLDEHFEIVSYKNNIKKGTASVVLRGLYPYGGTKTVKFKIVQKPVENHWYDGFDKLTLSGTNVSYIGTPEAVITFSRAKMETGSLKFYPPGSDTDAEPVVWENLNIVRVKAGSTVQITDTDNGTKTGAWPFLIENGAYGEYARGVVLTSGNVDDWPTTLFGNGDKVGLFMLRLKDSAGTETEYCIIIEN